MGAKGNLPHHFNRAVIVAMVAVRMMQVAVVEIIGVAIMADGGVAAAIAVLVAVAGVRVALFLRHLCISLWWGLFPYSTPGLRARRPID